MDFSRFPVIITGGTGALGRVVTGHFLRAGGVVAATYIQEKELGLLPEDLRRSTYFVQTDVTSESGVQRLFDLALAKFGSCAILVNTVGGYLPPAPLSRVTLKDWDNMMNLNLRSAFLCSREFLRRHPGTAYGRIINIGAQPALRPAAERAPYAISKGGVVMLTEILGEELKNSRITVNVIAPSILDTPANRASMPDADFTKWVNPEDVAATILFLCSDAAGSINGITLPVFGGS